MAATVSPWAKPGAWALDSEEHEAELQQLKDKEAAEPLADFPSLSAAATTKPKKKKGQTVSLAEFTTYGGAKPAAQHNDPKGLTHEDRLKLPTGPRERSDEELDRNRLWGGGSRTYGSYDRNNRPSNGDESSNSRWGSSRGSERNGGGGFGRDSNRESGPSRADETDNWAAAKKSPTGNGFERKDRGGFFDSQSKADESDSWVSNKSFVPSEGRRFGSAGGAFERERRGSFNSNGGGADSDNWGKKKDDSNGVTVDGTESGRPRLNLQPRTLPVSDGGSQGSGTVAAKPKGSNPFGDARPREDVLAEKGQDWKKIDEQLGSVKIKETDEKADGGSSFGKRGFGIGNGRAGLSSERTEKTWRKPDVSDARPTSSAEKIENGNAEEIENGNAGEIENGNAEKIEDVDEN